MNKTPFQSSYWVIPDKLLAGGFPASTDSIIRKIKLRELIKTGTKVVVNLMEENERNYLNKLFYNYTPDLNRHNIASRRFPIKDMSVPSVIQMSNILDYIDEALDQNKAVYVHCWGGVGRTGMVVGCFLIRQGLADSSNVFQVIDKLKSESGIADRQSRPGTRRRTQSGHPERNQHPRRKRHPPCCRGYVQHAVRPLREIAARAAN